MPRRIIHQTTPGETARLNALADDWDREKDVMIDQFARKEAAAEGDSLAAQVRKALLESLIFPDAIAKDLGVDVDLVHRFQLAEEDLPFAVFEKLVKRLGLKLVRDTPAEASQAASVCEPAPFVAS